ncbi:hypothetical protein BHE74_00059531 [Ensete ventricosum]|nr:hypothetical protein BHE74_00059531 [Ensete ventricosum]
MTALRTWLRGILSLSQAIRNMTERWLVEVRLSPASRGTMDMNMLQKKPRMPGGKGAPAVDPESSQPEVEVTHAGASGKRSVGVRLLIQLPLADPKSRDLCGMRIREDDGGYYVLQMADWAPKDSSNAPTLAKDLYTLPSEVLIARASKQIVLIALLDRVHDSGRLVTHMGNQASLLKAELEKLRSKRNPEQLALARQRVDELEADNAKMKSELDESRGRLDEADKELNKLREGLVESQRQLKEQKADHRKADDELLKLMRENESLKAELSGKSISNYKQSIGFGWGLRRIGQVSYKYGYRVALARFQAWYPDLEIDNDPFSERPEDSSVPMETHQEFDDSVPPPED